MKHIDLFFCDIMGTLKGNKYNTDEDYNKFNKLLNKLADNNKIFFSLISSDNSKVVSEWSNYLGRYLNGNVINESNFFYNGKIINNQIRTTDSRNKAEQILEEIDDIKNVYIVDKVYYADDVEMNHSLLSFYFEERNFDEELVSIIPRLNIGLEELNQIIENFYNNKKVL